MLKKLIATIIGKTLAKKLKIVDDTVETVPQPGTPVTKVPWYQSKAKLSAICLVISVAINKLSGPVFGHQIYVSDDVFKVLEALGLYGLRDAIKTATPDAS
jgi:hypothetical protein